MSQTVQLEDGSIHQFPDDATSDEINAALPPSPAQDAVPGYVSGAIPGRGTVGNTFPAAAQVEDPYGKIGNTPLFKSGIDNAMKAITTADTMAMPEFNIFGGAPTTLKGLANMAARIGANATGIGTAAAVNNAISMNPTQENPLQSFISAGKESLAPLSILEAGSMPARGPRGIAEMLNPQEKAADLAEQFKQLHAQGQQKAQEHYAQTNLFNKDLMTDDPKNYFDFHPDEEEQYFTPNVKRAYRTFKNNPTYENSQSLQTQMGTDAAARTGNPASQDQADALFSARRKVKSNTVDFLNSKHPEAGNSYLMGDQVSKNEVYPAENSSFLTNLLQIPGRPKNLDPKLFSKELDKTVKDNNLSSLHPLNIMSNTLKNHINYGNAMQNIIPLGLAGGASYYHPGLAGLAAIGGGAALKYFEPQMIKIVQNPWLQSKINSLAPVYYGAGRGLIRYNQSEGNK